MAGCSAPQGMAPRAAAQAGAAALPQTAGYAFGQSGGALLVARPAQPLGYAEGLAAKRAAQAHCAGQGRVLNPAAFGRYQAGAWAFDGGCV
jgi:hypothetical protein